MASNSGASRSLGTIFAPALTAFWSRSRASATRLCATSIRPRLRNVGGDGHEPRTEVEQVGRAERGEGVIREEPGQHLGRRRGRQRGRPGP